MKGKKFALTGIFLGYLNVLLILILIVLVKYFIDALSRLPSEQAVRFGFVSFEKKTNNCAFSPRALSFGYIFTNNHP